MMQPDWVTQSPLTVAWWEFHEAHPEVGQMLHDLGVDLVHKGHDHIGVKMLWETMRYYTKLGATPGEDAYRLNNNHHAYYARWLMETYDELDGVFELRSSSAESPHDPNYGEEVAA